MGGRTSGGPWNGQQHDGSAVDATPRPCLWAVAVAAVAVAAGPAFPTAGAFDGRWNHPAPTATPIARCDPPVRRAARTPWPDSETPGKKSRAARPWRAYQLP